MNDGVVMGMLGFPCCVAAARANNYFLYKIYMFLYVRCTCSTKVNDIKAACIAAKLFRPCPESPQNKAQTCRNMQRS